MVACQPDENVPSLPSGPKIYTIPVVVHLIHFGTPVGEAYNYSVERVAEQLKTLNDDFRRRPGTNGFNEHPASADSRIEFRLATIDPQGLPTSGIVRVDTANADFPEGPLSNFMRAAALSYWDPSQYLNIWCIPFPGLEDLFLGEATGPNTDLPGGNLFTPGEPLQPEGVVINAAHFGTTEGPSDYNLGRTLTHEIGHYLGLLHLWGEGDCTTNDFCADTPAASDPIHGCPESASTSCNGALNMVENYMTFSPDRCVHVFTCDQIKRMRYVLENSPYRTSLLSSPGLGPS